LKTGLKTLFFVATPFLFVTGCGTLSNGRGWGEDAIYPVQLERIPRAAYHALVDWQTLVPTAGALFFRIGSYDQKVSDWATEHHPLFGSRRAAEIASDYILVGLYAETLGTALATPSGDSLKEWTYSKIKGITVEGMALGLTAGITTSLQHLTNRTRPDESNTNSFPSGHASGAFAAATLSNRNLDSIPMPSEAKIPLQVGNVILSTADAWARIEGKNHFPSDVLAGAALGHFLSAFIHDAFLGLPEREGFAVSITPVRGGAIGQLSFSF
jgi:membrane-associated phospholipid phosphatase